ncbi:MAG: DUF2061 domain-containing protein [Gammaproteobacteria bacterium]|nr:DUF2061 domain-containing protein [Gammaproteobacteria bacterium]
MSILRAFIHDHDKMSMPFLKTLTFAATHFTVAFLVAWALTGDVLVGGLVAMVEPAINTVAYFIHERVWQGRTRAKHAEHNAGVAC